jgi:hypothetical protein
MSRGNFWTWGTYGQGFFMSSTLLKNLKKKPDMCFKIALYILKNQPCTNKQGMKVGVIHFTYKIKYL